jgi:hypothetical protein
MYAFEWFYQITGSAKRLSQGFFWEYFPPAFAMDVIRSSKIPMDVGLYLYLVSKSSMAVICCPLLELTLGESGDI